MTYFIPFVLDTGEDLMYEILVKKDVVVVIGGNVAVGGSSVVIVFMVI